MQTIRHFRFSISSMLLFTAVVALGLAFWQSGESTRTILKLFFHGLIAIAAWLDCREYNRVQSPFDSVGFRWFYRIARTTAIIAFLLHAIKTLIMSQAFPSSPMLESWKYFFDFSPDFSILFSAIVGGMPLSESYFRGRGTLWQRSIGRMGGIASAALILFVAFDSFWIITLVIVAVLGIGWATPQPVLPYDDPIQLFGTLEILMSDQSVVVDSVLAAFGAFGIAILVLSPKGSLRAKLGLLVAVSCAFPVVFGLVRYWNASALFHSDLRQADLKSILSGIPLFGLGLGLLAGYLSFAKSKSHKSLTGFVLVEYQSDSFFSSVGVGGVVVTELIFAAFTKRASGFFAFNMLDPAPWYLLLFCVFIVVMGFRLLVKRGAFSLVWWIVGHLIVAGTISCGLYSSGKSTDFFLYWGSNVGWSVTSMQIWVYFIRVSLLMTVVLLITKRFRKKASATNPIVGPLWRPLLFYLLLTGIIVYDLTALEGTLGWVFGVPWILPVVKPIYGMLAFLWSSFVTNYEMGALIVLWLYGMREATFQPASIPSPSQALCWRFSFRRFVCLLVLLPIYVPATIIFGLRLMVHLYAMANNLTAGI